MDGKNTTAGFLKVYADWRGLFVSPALIALGLSAIAHADGKPSRTWEFDLKLPGTYKVQVEHGIKDIDGFTPGVTKVTYSITIGKETQSRELYLVAGQPFLPLVTDIPSPQKMRVVITGLSQPALQHTSVQVYDANFQGPEQYLEATKSVEFKEAKRIREILKRPAEEIDLGTVKVSFDKLIDPTIDVERTLEKIDSMVATIKTLPEYGATSAAKLAALQRYVYDAGPWNGDQPFTYDLDDPLGHKFTNKLLPTYLASKKGNCVTMPILFVILGQRLGLEITLSTAPKHFLVKFKSDEFGWINLEATSGAKPARDVWIRQQFPMTDRAIKNGVYLQPLTKKEAVAEMAAVVDEYFFARQEYQKAITVADIVLEYCPKDVGTMVLKGAAYGRLGYATYPSPAAVPGNNKGHFIYLAENNRLWFAKAEALGWRAETKEEEKTYLRNVEQARQRQTTH